MTMYTGAYVSKAHVHDRIEKNPCPKDKIPPGTGFKDHFFENFSREFSHSNGELLPGIEIVADGGFGHPERQRDYY
jgi:hypothetical protein